MKLERIALTTDFSPCARHAYPVAADLAAKTGGSIELVHWVDYPFPYTAAGFYASDSALASFRDVEAVRLADEAKHPAFTKSPPSHRILDGYGPDAVAEFAVEARIDLIVQASHGYGGFKRLLLGSFAERVLRSAKTPVLTVKAEDGGAPARLAPKTILYPHDLSPCSAFALDAVRFFARLHGARVVVVHVWDEIPSLTGMHGLAGEAAAIELEVLREELPERALKELKEIGARELAGLEHEEHFCRGNPAEVIAARAAAHGADLICMATHGWTGLKRVVLGSTAEKVTRLAECPTLTVRPPAEVLKDEFTVRRARAG